MGRPNVIPRNNFNPMFHAQPEPPVEKKRVQAEQRYPTNGGMSSQQNQVPIDRPGQSPNIVINNMVNQPNQVQMVRPVPTYGIQMVSPVQIVRPVVQPSNWTTGFCDCFNDVPNTIITCFFPFITFGQIAEVIDEGATSCGMAGTLYLLICCLICVPCVYTCTYRTKLRIKYGLPDIPLPDFILHCCCEPCALCQEYRELSNRGIDPAIGWIGNVQRMVQQQEMMAPPMSQRMMK